jgi:hypothetical protein
MMHRVTREWNIVWNTDPPVDVIVLPGEQITVLESYAYAKASFIAFDIHDSSGAVETIMAVVPDSQLRQFTVAI